MGKTPFKKNCSGTTMVEVIVAFFIMVIIMGIFSQAMRLSGNMMIRADETLTGYRSLAGSYYLEGDADPNGARAKAIEADVKENQRLVFVTENGQSSFEIGVSARTVRDGSGELRDVVSTHTGGGSDTGGDGPDPGEEDKPDEITYNVICELMTYGGEFTHGDYRVNWNLDGHPNQIATLQVKAQKSDIGKTVAAPLVENYSAQEDYVVPVDGGWVNVKYMPDDVPLKIRHECDGKMLGDTEVDVKYRSNVTLYSNAVFPNYVLTGNSTGNTGNIHQAGLLVNNPAGMDVTFYYKHNVNSYIFYGRQDADSKNIQAGDYTGSWKLDDKIVYQSVLTSDTQTANSPDVENYKPVQPTYQIPADNGSVTVSYVPDEVEIIVYHKIGDTLLTDPETLSVKTRYGAELTLHSNKEMDEEGFKIDNESVTVDVKSPGQVQVVFTYIDEDAPFHPVNGNPKVNIVSGEADERTIQIQERMADLFTGFFSDEWGKGRLAGFGKLELWRYGYKTFTMKNGEKYAVVGYCGLEKVSGDIKDVESLSRVTGVDTDNMLALDNCQAGGFEKQEEANVLWKYLVESMNGLTTAEKELMLSVSDVKFQFKEERKGFLLPIYNHYLQKITYTLPTTPETEIEITY